MAQAPESSAGSSLILRYWVPGAVVVTGLAWLGAWKWSEQMQAATSALVGVALVFVTWEYTTHTRSMVDEMRDQRVAADHVRRAEPFAAAAALCSELRELRHYLAELQPPDGRADGTRPPYPTLELVSLDAYVRHMDSMPADCTRAVFAVHYQLIAANARAQTNYYFQRANALPDRIDKAMTHLTQFSEQALV